MENFTNLRRFFDEFKNLSFWQRIFSWKGIRVLRYAAYEDVVQITDQLTRCTTDLESLRHERELLLQEKASFQKQNAEARETLLKFESRLQHVDHELKKIEKENQELHRKALVADQKEEQRRKDHDQSLNRLHVTRHAREGEGRD